MRCDASSTVRFLSVAATTLVLTALAPAARAHAPVPLPAPVVVDSGFEPAHLDPVLGPVAGYLWLRFDLVDLPSRRYLLEPIAGAAPASLARIWQQPMLAQDGQLFITVPPGDAPSAYDFGIEVRAANQYLSKPSAPVYFRAAEPGAVWLGEAAPAPAGDQPPQRNDQLLFVLALTVLSALWLRRRGVRDPDTRLRLVAVSGLVSAVLLLVTSAMPWLATALGARPVECLLGDETRCLALPPIAFGDLGAAAAATFEIERWQCAAAAVQMGQILSFSLLLPGLVWLLVEPRSRPAQASVAVGASITAFTLLAIWFYRSTVPSWAAPELYRTFDVAMLSAGNAVVAALAIVRHAFATDPRPSLPHAIVRS